MSLKRLLALVAAAMFSMLSLSAGPAQAAIPACDGVWVVVQPDEAKPEGIEAKCAPDFGTGTAALASAGFAAELAGDMITRIGGAPKDADYNTNGNYYWSYWKAPVDADGAVGAWEYYTVAPSAAKPAKGNAEGWLLTNKQDAKGPALTSIAAVAPAESAPATSAPANPDQQPQGSEAPVGAIVAGTLVVVAILGLGGWWFMKGRRR